MESEIIPAVNVETFDEVEKKIRLVEPYARWIHLDVADGSFTPNIIWHNPNDLKGFKTPLLIELHLMVRNPEWFIDDWIEAGAKRIIIHADAPHDFDAIKRKCDAAGVLLTLSITPESSWTILIPFLKRQIVSLQVLSVHPGLSGQTFIEGGGEGSSYLESSYEKIKRLREQSTSCDIEVDGGVKIGIAKKCREAGATLFAIASAIYGAPDIAKAIEELKKDVQ